jgi:hypothetical protein
LCPVEDIIISDIFYQIQKFLKASRASIITTNGINFLMAGPFTALYCTRVAGSWDWLFSYLSTFLPPALLTEEDCITLLYPSLGNSQIEDSVSWLLGSYLVVMMDAAERGRVVVEQELRGHLRQKYIVYGMKRTRPLNLNNL